MSHVSSPPASATRRFAYVMATTYPDSGLSAAQRAWLLARLAQSDPVREDEHARIWAVVRPWLAQVSPQILVIVERGAPERTPVRDVQALAYLAGAVKDTGLEGSN